MAKITILDQNTINKIAAGEVIERPSSVVKELLENAIDAQASAITVEIRDGGISFIRVTDNGCGIPGDEVPLAFLRHSTSKIKSVEDLFTVASLGFRGEALSSIAAVSQVELISKTPGQLSGVRYQIEGGKERSVEEIGVPDGTTFLVRNLFFNTPARRKFLKTAQTEGSHVAALVEKIALSHPDISIRFIQNNQNKLHTSGNHNLKDIIYTVFGREIALNLIPVEYKEDVLQVRGYAGKPMIARSNRNFENYYINGRYIKSSLIAKAIEDAYKPFMMQHKYPFVLLHLTIEPEYLDVNVHPTKMELRFRNDEQIYRIISSTLREALAHKELIPQVSLNQEQLSEKKTSHGKREGGPRPEPFEVKRRGYYEAKSSERKQEYIKPAETERIKETCKEETDRFNKNRGSRPDLQTGERQTSQTSGNDNYKIQPEHPIVAEERSFRDTDGTFQRSEKEKKKIKEDIQGKEPKAKQLNLFEEKLLAPESRRKHKLIGQLFGTYWLVEFGDNLYIIDQHAAHEKVLYEKTMTALKNREQTTQMVNPPVILTLSSEEQVLLEKYMVHFTKMGFEIEHFGGKEYAVRGVPDNLFSIAKKELFMEMLDSLSDDIFKGNPDIIYEKVASMSCKAAVKGNHSMSFIEADNLIDQLLELENPYACPHGRPIIISMSKYELERKFKRIV